MGSKVPPRSATRSLTGAELINERKLRGTDKYSVALDATCAPQRIVHLLPSEDAPHPLQGFIVVHVSATHQPLQIGRVQPETLILALDRQHALRIKSICPMRQQVRLCRRRIGARL